MFYVSLVLLSLGVAGIAYFVISTVLNRKKRVTVGGSNDDYADDYSSSGRKSERRSKYDTAEIQLPKNSQKGGRRYK